MKQEHKMLYCIGPGELCELLLGNLQKVIEKGKLFTSVTSLSLSEPVPTLETSSFHKMKRLTQAKNCVSITDCTCINHIRIDHE